MPDHSFHPAPRTAGQTAAALIRDQILSGQMSPGSTLNQNELAIAFGMSRIPIRDALAILAGEGLVQIRAHSTATVTPLSLDDLQELYDLRLAVEPRLSREALAHVGRDDLEVMAETLELLDEADGSQWLDLNRRFHETLYLCSGKPRSIEFVDRMRRATDRYTSVYFRFDRAKVQLEHRLIYEAAVAGHPRRLEALITAHLSDGYETMLRYLANQGTFQSEEPDGISASQTKDPLNTPAPLAIGS